MDTLREYLVGIMFWWFVLSFSMTCASSYAQSPGDFRTAANGDWTALASWQVYNGTGWVPATAYPGQLAGNYSVEILPGSVISTSGIVTETMGTLTISGTLRLNGSTSSTSVIDLKTDLVNVSRNLTPADNATIAFYNKCVLVLPGNAVLKVQHGLTPSCVQGLSGDCNNNEEIHIGPFNLANCHGAPGSLFTFSELMDGGGTLVALQSIPPNKCQGEEIQLQGNYAGTALSTGVTYSWSNTGPASLVFTPSNTAQNPTVNPTVPGLYTISLTVTTDNGSVYYNNTQSSTLIVAPTTSLTYVAICQGDSSRFNGKYYKSSGIYSSAPLLSSAGCDSTAVLDLTVLEAFNTTIKDTICKGETYVFNGIPYTDGGNYTVNVGVGCSTTTLALKVSEPSYYEYNDTICQGNTYSFNGSTYNTNGTYVYHSVNSVGCDSTVVLNLTVNPLPTVTNTSLTETICSGTSTTLVTLASDVASTTFDWTATADSAVTGFTTSGTGTIPAEILTNHSGSTTGTVTYVITPKANGCTGTAVSYVVLVTPKPATSNISHQ
ncbi:MAG TPA: PKD-like domain-containing protein [Paludibacter sp.]|nr:PKD-like domain-containing protein [Paludibacter sp.]